MGVYKLRKGVTHYEKISFDDSGIAAAWYM